MSLDRWSIDKSHTGTEKTYKLDMQGHQQTWGIIPGTVLLAS